jgi:hypothetical protein
MILNHFKKLNNWPQIFANGQRILELFMFFTVFFRLFTIFRCLWQQKRSNWCSLLQAHISLQTKHCCQKKDLKSNS